MSLRACTRRVLARSLSASIASLLPSPSSVRSMPPNRSLASSVLMTDRSPADARLAVEQVGDRGHGVELELLVGIELEFHGASAVAV